jgi:hypothetical protein
MVLLEKIAPGQTIAEQNTIAKRSKNKRDCDEFTKKWSEISEGEMNMLKRAKHTYFIQNTILHLLCPLCVVFREATTDNFSANNVSRHGDMDGWFDHFPHSFYCGTSRGCNQCFAHKLRVRDNDAEGDGLIRHIMGNYPELHVVLTDAEKIAYANECKKRTGRTLCKVPYTDGGVRWLKRHLGKECWATGFTMNAQIIKSHPLNPSPNGLDLHEHGYSTKTGHAPERTVAVAKFANVRQHGIPDLREAFTTMYRTMVADWRKTPEERFKDEDEMLKTIEIDKLPRVITNIASNSLQADKKKGRECDLKTGADVVKRLKAVRMRCHTSGVLLSVESGWNKAHGDRIDDDIGHVDGNLEWKCALFSEETRLTRKQFLHGFLHQQKRVDIPDAMRAELEIEYEIL